MTAGLVEMICVASRPGGNGTRLGISGLEYGGAGGADEDEYG